MAEGFFSRWSRRKQEAGVSSLPAATPASVASDPVDRQAPAPATGPEPAQEPELQPANLPTLEDVQTLTPQSDFQPFMQRGVGHVPAMQLQRHQQGHFLGLFQRLL